MLTLQLGDGKSLGELSMWDTVLVGSSGKPLNLFVLIVGFETRLFFNSTNKH